MGKQASRIEEWDDKWSERLLYTPGRKVMDATRFTGRMVGSTLKYFAGEQLYTSLGFLGRDIQRGTLRDLSSQFTKDNAENIGSITGPIVGAAVDFIALAAGFTYLANLLAGGNIEKSFGGPDDWIAAGTAMAELLKYKVAGQAIGLGYKIGKMSEARETRVLAQENS